MRRLVPLVAAIVAAGAPGAGAATIDVTTTFDTTSADGKCSLREAVRAADLDAVAVGGANECPAGTGADVIALPPGSYDRSAVGIDDNNTAGDLDVAGTLTIAGAGAALTTIDAKGLDRVIDVIAGADLTITGVTITGGAAPNGGNGSAVTGTDGNPGAPATGGSGTPGSSGGGIQNNGTLTVADSIITANSAGDGGKGALGIGGNGTTGTGATGGTGNGGAGDRGGNGGGIWSGHDLTLTRVVVSANHAGDGGNGADGIGGVGGFPGGHGGFGKGGLSGFGGDGGGIFIAGGTATVDRSTIRANTAGASGNAGTGKGGLGGSASSGNGGVGGDASGSVAEEGGSGGAIDMSAGTVLLTRDLVDANTAGQGGVGGGAVGGTGGATSGATGGHGGEATAYDGGSGGAGGGVDSDAGTVSDTTVTGNMSGTGGSGGAATGGKGGAGSSGAGAGGAAYGGDGGSGGYTGGLGLYNTAVNHATITQNKLGAGAHGGGATGGTGSSTGAAFGGGDGTTFSGGAIYSGSTASLRNSIIAGNDNNACTPGLTDLGGNVSFGDASCPGADADPLLEALADNGGPTLTRRPAVGSPVRDAIAAISAGCTPTDQRAVARPGGGGCDAGAYEVAPPIALINTAAPTVAGTVNPSARATNARFDVGTTTQYGSSTPDIVVPAGVEAVPVTADLPGLAPSTTYHVRLVATNADGTGTSDDATFTTSAQGGGGNVADTTAPVILSASVKPKTFKRRRGTTLRYKLSEAAKVAFTVQRKKGKRFVKAKKFSKTSKAGANKRKLVTRKLKPGRYRATLVATDAAKNRSKPKRLTFRVKR
jgi:CSLREA domain-containing protein